MRVDVRQALGAVVRVLWVLLGLIFSVVPVLKPVALAAALFGVLGLQGVGVGTALARSFGHGGTLWLPLTIAVFAMYWLCVGVLSYQFVRGRRLSRLAGAIVAAVAAVFLIIGQPWNDSGQPFVPGPEDLLHIIFLLGLALYAARVQRSTAQPSSV
jgi:hypothetical protein